MNKKNGIFKKIINSQAAKVILTFAFWILVWQGLSMYIGKEILLPSPLVTLKTLIRLLSMSDFYKALAQSILRITTGLLAGIAIGSLFALLSFLSPFIKALLSPLKSVVKATPVASFIILLYVWLGKSEIPGVVASMIVIPIVWENLLEGLASCDKKLLEVAKIYDFSLLKKLKYIYIPHLKPYFAAGCVSATGLAWKAGIAAETLVVATGTIGGMLYDSKIFFETPELFALTAVVIVISVLIEKMVYSIVTKAKRIKEREMKNDNM